MTKNVDSGRKDLTSVQVKSRGTDEQQAGYNSALQGVIPIVLTPATGLFFDRIGWRMVFGELTCRLRFRSTNRF